VAASTMVIVAGWKNVLMVEDGQRNWLGKGGGVEDGGAGGYG
jgi:hypothetical protein